MLNSVQLQNVGIYLGIFVILTGGTYYLCRNYKKFSTVMALGVMVIFTGIYFFMIDKSNADYAKSQELVVRKSLVEKYKFDNVTLNLKKGVKGDKKFEYALTTLDGEYDFTLTYPKRELKFTKSKGESLIARANCLSALNMIYPEYEWTDLIRIDETKYIANGTQQEGVQLFIEESKGKSIGKVLDKKGNILYRSLSTNEKLKDNGKQENPEKETNDEQK